jgi:solute carrier family 35 protein E1
LTFGVMLATSVDFSLSNVFGLFCAFGSTIVFVSQNIFFKKIMPTNAESSTSSKLDKINLLFYSSGTAFVLMVPLWLYSDAWRVMNHVLPPNAPSITLYFFLNGTVHFARHIFHRITRQAYSRHLPRYRMVQADCTLCPSGRDLLDWSRIAHVQ